MTLGFRVLGKNELLVVLLLFYHCYQEPSFYIEILAGQRCDGVTNATYSRLIFRHMLDNLW